MFEFLEEIKSDYDDYHKKMDKLNSEKFRALENLDSDFNNINCKKCNVYDASWHKILEDASIKEANLMHENEEMLQKRRQYIKKVCENSAFDLKMVGPSFAKVLSFLKQENYEFNEKIVPIDIVYYTAKYSSEVLKYTTENFICGYISKNGVFPKQEYPIEYDDVLSLLFEKDELVLYETRKLNTNFHTASFYTEFGSGMLYSRSKDLQDFVDELIKYKLETGEELTAVKCDELACLYISKLKKDKPKTLSKQL